MTPDLARYSDDPPCPDYSAREVDDEPEDLPTSCAGCEVEIVPGEHVSLGRRGWCPSCAIVEAAQVVALALDDSTDPTPQQVSAIEEAERVLSEMRDEAVDRLRAVQARREREWDETARAARRTA